MTSNTGVYGESGHGFGVIGNSISGTGVVAQSQSGVALHATTGGGGPCAVFDGGDVLVSKSLVALDLTASDLTLHGQLTVENTSQFQGTIFATTFFCPLKFFRIDHPLDPANKYLVHASVESSERKNLYDGTVKLDRKGEASVKVPDWFEALNGSFRYQLTAIGAAAPNLHVAKELAGGRFRIAGGKSGMRVSWQITGIRRDAVARYEPMEVEQEKPEHERGYYQNPEAHGQPRDKGIAALGAPEARPQVRSPIQIPSFRPPARPVRPEIARAKRRSGLQAEGRGKTKRERRAETKRKGRK